jgi:DNA-binding CsgD family transcriptional regulator
MREILDRFTGNISPVALLVSSFFWSWFDVVPFSPALFAAAGVVADVKPFVVSFIASVLTLLLLTASSRLRSLVFDSRVFAACSLVCGRFGSLAIYLGTNLSPTLLFTGGVLIGVYMSVGAVLCGSIAVCQGTTNALIHLAAALPLNIVAILLVVFLQPLASAVFATWLPLFSALCFAIYLVRGHNRQTVLSVTIAQEKPKACSPKERKLFGCDPFFFLMVLVICVSFGFTNYQAIFAALPPVSADFDYITIVIRAAVSLVTLLGYLLLSWRPYSILRAALVLMSLGLVAGGVMLVLGISGAFLLNYLFLIGFACFDLLIWAIIAMLGYKSGTSLLRIICAVYVVDQFGILIGTIIGLKVDNDSIMTAVYIVLGCALMLVAVGFSGGQNALQLSLSKYEVAFGKADADIANAAVSEGIASGHEGRIRELASIFFLTARETGVLTLLVAGRNGPYISEHLHVSENTIKSHVRHIYTKLNVHNRQELLDLVFPQVHEASH